MPSPTSLTATPAPTLDWSRDGIPASTDFDDIYFSVDNGLEETKAVFLSGCGLPEAWQGRRKFTIGELGFGTGLNVLAAWQLWQHSKPKNGHLHILSVEKYPLSKSDLARALMSWPELKFEAETLVKLWPGRVKGLHRLHLSHDVTLTLSHMDVTAALTAMKANVNAWFLDGFSPAKNPDMWSPEIMQLIARQSAPGAHLGTFTVAGYVREGLSAAGFTPRKMPGFGRKRNRLEAIYKGNPEPCDSSAIKPIIIGGGIAGASIAKGFSRRDIVPILIENDQIAASGNPAAIIKPRLDLQDRPESRFFLGSYLYALQAYAETGAVIERGVKHVATAQELARYRKLVANAPLPSEHLSCEAESVSYGQSIVIHPNIVLEDWKQLTQRLEGTAKHIRRENGAWHVYDSDGILLAAGTHVILAAGFGINDLNVKENFDLRYTRGQLTWGKSVKDVTAPNTYGGYAIPLEEGLLLGAANAHLSRMDGQDPYRLMDTADDENIQSFKDATGLEAVRSDRASRSSVRVVSKDTLPKYAEIEKGFWGLTALGSRGFSFAPLLGEAIVSEICGDPLPIDTALRARFGAREKPNLKTRPG